MSLPGEEGSLEVVLDWLESLFEPLLVEGLAPEALLLGLSELLDEEDWSGLYEASELLLEEGLLPCEPGVVLDESLELPDSLSADPPRPGASRLGQLF